MDSSLYSLGGLSIADFPELHAKLQTAFEEIDRLQLNIPIQSNDLSDHVEVIFDKAPEAIEDLNQGQLETKLQAANEHITTLQQQLQERDRDIEVLQQDLQQVTSFTELLTFDVCSSDKVADMLDNELKATRTRVNKLSRDLLLACQVLQSKHKETQELSMSLQLSHETQAKYQKQTQALRNLFADKVADNNNLHNAVEVAKRMLLEFPALMQSMKEQQVAVEAAAALSSREAAQAKKALDDAKAQITKLEGSLNCVGSQPPSCEDVDKWKAELEAKAELLKAALRELEDANTHHQELSRSLSIKDDTIQHLHRQLRSLEHELQDQKRIVERLDAEKAAAAAAAEIIPEELGADAKYERLAKQLAKIKEELFDTKRKLKETQVSHARAESQIQGAKTVLSTKNSQCHRLETELRVAESRLRELQSTHKAVSDDLTQRLEDARNQVRLLDSKYLQASRQTVTLERQLLHAKSQIADLLEGLGVDGSPLLKAGRNLVSFATATSPGSTPTFVDQTWGSFQPGAAGSAHETLEVTATAGQLPELLTRSKPEEDRYTLPPKTREQLDLVKGLLTQLGATVELTPSLAPSPPVRMSLQSIGSIAAT